MFRARGVFRRLVLGRLLGVTRGGGRSSGENNNGSVSRRVMFFSLLRCLWRLFTLSYSFVNPIADLDLETSGHMEGHPDVVEYVETIVFKSQGLWLTDGLPELDLEEIIRNFG